MSAEKCTRRDVQKVVFARERFRCQLTDLVLQKLRGILAAASIPFHNDQTPNASDPQSWASPSVDALELRCSEYRKVDTSEIFDLLQQELLPMLPDANDLTLILNETINIKDIESGFIKSHRGHRPLSSNSLEESPPLYIALIYVAPKRESITQANQRVYLADNGF